MVGLSISRKRISKRKAKTIFPISFLFLRQILPGKSTFNFRLEKTRGEFSRQLRGAKLPRATWSRRTSSLKQRAAARRYHFSSLWRSLARKSPFSCHRIALSRNRYVMLAMLVVNRLAADFGLTSARRFQQTRGQKFAMVREQNDDM